MDELSAGRTKTSQGSQGQEEKKQKRGNIQKDVGKIGETSREETERKEERSTEGRAPKSTLPSTERDEGR